MSVLLHERESRLLLVHFLFIFLLYIFLLYIFLSYYNLAVARIFSKLGILKIKYGLTYQEGITLPEGLSCLFFKIVNYFCNYLPPCMFVIFIPALLGCIGNTDNPNKTGEVSKENLSQVTQTPGQTSQFKEISPIP